MTSVHSIKCTINTTLIDTIRIMKLAKAEAVHTHVYSAILKRMVRIGSVEHLCPTTTLIREHNAKGIANDL